MVISLSAKHIVSGSAIGERSKQNLCSLWEICLGYIFVNSSYNGFRQSQDQDGEINANFCIFKTHGHNASDCFAHAVASSMPPITPLIILIIIIMIILSFPHYHHHDYPEFCKMRGSGTRESLVGRRGESGWGRPSSG